MRNLKKFLALVLAMMMVLSLMVTANAAFFDDVGEANDYYKAIEILHGMQVFTGYEDGNFHPEKDITRAEVAAILYRAHSGDIVTNAESYKSYIGAFTDTNGHWGAGYINYASISGLIEGYGDGRFGPNDKVTGYQVITMFLRAIGYGKKPGEFQGSTWYKDTANRAAELYITEGITTDLTKPATRGLVAELVFRTIALCNTVSYTPALDYYTEDFGNVDRRTLANKKFGLAVTPVYNSDGWGTPVEHWYDGGFGDNFVKHGTYVDFPYKEAASFQTALAECEIYEYYGVEGDVESVWVDGNEFKISDAIQPTGDDVYPTTLNRYDVDALWGGQGVKTKIYDLGNKTYRVVEINTYLAKVSKVNEEDPDRGGHEHPRTVDLEVYNVEPVGDGIEIDVVTPAQATAEAPANVSTVTGYSNPNLPVLNKGDYLLVNILKPSTAASGVTTGTRIAATAIKNAAIALPLTTGQIIDTEAADYPDPANTTVNKEENNHPDAEKYYLNYHADGNWDFLDDGMGNIIGQGKAAYKLAVLSKIAWRSEGGVSEEEYAEAELIPLAETTGSARAISDNAIIVRIDQLNGQDVEMKEEVPEDPAGYEVSDSAKKNSVFSGHIVVYSENEDTTVNIITHAYDEELGGVYFSGYEHTDTAPALPERQAAGAEEGAEPLPAVPAAQATITRGQADIKITTPGGYDEEAADDAEDTYTQHVGDVIGHGTEDTVYYVQQEDGTYKRYVGKNNVPTVTGTVCVMADEETGFAILVVVSSPDTSISETFLAFIPNLEFTTDTKKSSKTINKVKYYGYDVYELGKYNGARKIFGIPATEGEDDEAVETGDLDLADDAVYDFDGPGVYEITVDGYGRVTDIVCMLNEDEVETNYKMDYVVVTSAPSKTTLKGYSMVEDDDKGYNLRSTKFVTVNGDLKSEDDEGGGYSIFGEAVTLKTGKLKNLEDASEENPILVIVIYEEGGSKKNPENFVDYVYICPDALVVAPDDDDDDDDDNTDVPTVPDKTTESDLEGSDFEGASIWIVSGLTGEVDKDTGTLVLSGTIPANRQIHKGDTDDIPGFGVVGSQFGDSARSTAAAIINVQINGNNHLWLISDKQNFTTITYGETQCEACGTTHNLKVDLRDLIWEGIDD